MPGESSPRHEHRKGRRVAAAAAGGLAIASIAAIFATGTTSASHAPKPEALQNPAVTANTLARSIGDKILNSGTNPTMSRDGLYVADLENGSVSAAVNTQNHTLTIEEADSTNANKVEGTWLIKGETVTAPSTRDGIQHMLDGSGVVLQTFDVTTGGVSQRELASTNMDNSDYGLIDPNNNTPPTAADPQQLVEFENEVQTALEAINSPA